jgi:RimJ/RimL family protein N-acetyltransferase
LNKQIPQATIEAFARSIFKEATKYGFGQIDVIKLINQLMGLCNPDDTGDSPAAAEEVSHRWLEPDAASQLPIHSDRIHIREFDAREDMALFDNWLPDRYGRFFVLSCATAQEITVDALAADARNHIGIVTLADGKPVGAMAYLDHSRRQRRAELRKLIGEPDARGHGLAEEATWLWILYGIHGLGLEKMYVSTLQTQIANIELNERIGFRVEGLLKNEVLIDGERCDVLRMGLSASDLRADAD